MKIFKCIVYKNDGSIYGTYDLQEDQLILPQLENYGVQINYDCREGICGACEMYLLRGKILDQYGEEKDTTDSELIKVCVCYPQSDLELKLID